MKQIIILVLAIFTAQAALAAGAPGAEGFTGAAALGMGLGEIKDETGAVPKTDMLYTEATLQFGYRFGVVAPIAQLGYRYIGQRTDPDEVSGNNVGGTGYTAGVGLDFIFSQMRIAGVYNLEGKYDLAKESGGGSKVSYDKVSGFHALIGYNWKPSWEFFVSTSQLKYKQKTVGASKSDIENNPLAQTLYGVGISYLF